MKTITPAELNKLRESGSACALLDVRTPAEHEKIHVPGVHLVPVDGLNPEALAATKGFEKDQSIYILCHSGTRAAKAARKMEGAGFANCVVVEGGTAAWAAAGLPVNQSDRWILPLNRQIQIIAGSLALAGAVLSFTVNPAWIFLSGFVGFGLILAGALDFCPMAILMAMMPWNKSSK
ncbi:MAG: rhodanese-like domain-containing protein [Verrucomicrobiota bacterium]